MKRYILIAGVNGAGKSTLFRSLDYLQCMPRINIDEIELHYVGICSGDLAKERIAYRVAHGGHGIPDKDVERRFIESRVQLKEILPLSDVAVLYDNTENFYRVAIYKSGCIENLSEKQPSWYTEMNL